MKNFQSFITEENVNDGDIQIAVITKVSSNKEEVVAYQLKKYSEILGTKNYYPYDQSRIFKSTDEFLIQSSKETRLIKRF